MVYRETASDEWGHFLQSKVDRGYNQQVNRKKALRNRLGSRQQGRKATYSTYARQKETLKRARLPSTVAL